MNVKNIQRINLPLTKEDVLSLHTGDIVLINGQIVTGRDRVHKFLFNEKPTKKQYRSISKVRSYTIAVR